MSLKKLAAALSLTTTFGALGGCVSPIVINAGKCSDVSRINTPLLQTGSSKWNADCGATDSANSMIATKNPALQSVGVGILARQNPAIAASLKDAASLYSAVPISCTIEDIKPSGDGQDGIMSCKPIGRLPSDLNPPPAPVAP